ncbi:MAG: dihydrolipoyl dehydrogenase [Nitrospiraceae bacterium]|nr:dihydrolipoyl dehydrogenase [Nitrospiraceae bacterium]
MRIAVLGAGPGGYVAAIRAAQLGAEVTVIEDTEVGGTCLNRGCIPTKTMIASTDLLAKARNLDRYGIDLAGSVSPNMEKIIGRKNRVVATQVKGIRGLFKSWGVTLMQGRGVMTSPNRITVTRAEGPPGEVDADRLIIATGSRPARIPALPFDGRSVLSSTEALNMAAIPSSLLIVGAGVIGCEFACIFRELGSEVTVVEMLDRAVANEDREISELLEKELKKKKIRLLTNTGVSKVEARDDGVHAWLSDGRELVAEKVLVSIGRAFNSEGIGAEAIGVRIGSRKEIVVNEKMETSVPGVYAVGDVTGGMLLAHVASTQGRIAAQNCMGGDMTLDCRVVPAAVFTSPEIASVGMRQQEAELQGLGIRIGRFQFRGLGKAHAIDEIAGFLKIIADAKTEEVVGAHIIGPHASDLIHEMAVAIRKGLTARDIAHTIHAHPTLAEGLLEAAEDVYGESVHVPKK